MKQHHPQWALSCSGTQRVPVFRDWHCGVPAHLGSGTAEGWGYIWGSMWHRHARALWWAVMLRQGCLPAPLPCPVRLCMMARLYQGEIWWKYCMVHPIPYISYLVKTVFGEASQSAQNDWKMKSLPMGEWRWEKEAVVFVRKSFGGRWLLDGGMALVVGSC